MNYLSSPNCSLTSYGGDNLDVLGCCTLDCNYKNYNYNLVFYITKVNSAPCILGLQACMLLNLVKRIDAIQEETNNSPFLNEYSDLFEGTGTIKIKPHHITLNNSISPVIHSPRKIPFSLMPDLKEELQSMVNENIIRKVTEPTDWVNSIVLVRKPSGKIRLCMDPRDLNKAIRREHYKIPTIEEITAKLNGAKYFTSLDADKGFWQIRLDEASSKLCTFHTPFGRYRFLRLPFGISSAPEVYQRTMKHILQGLDGVEIYIDDLIIWGNSLKEHDRRVRSVLNRLSEYGVKLNKSKSRFCVKEINYLGHKISQSGIEIDQNKVKTITEMKSPQNKKSLQRFLGMVNYVSKFIPDHAQVVAPLRELLHKNIEWHWEERHQKSFQNLKEFLSQPPVLQFFDINKQLVLSVDASHNSVGAVLLQENKPVAYFSKSLTPTQCNYAQIEKEMLAILIGCEKFYQYLYGRKITVETDHKPLVNIFNKPISMCPLRLQRMFLRLQHFDIDLVYKPGKELVIADTLSRMDSVNVNEINEIQLQVDTEAQIQLIFKTLNLPQVQINKIRKETVNDSTLVMLKDAITKGWPDNKYDVPLKLKPYENYKDELSIFNNIIFRGNRVVIPESMRRNMLNMLHIPHLGIEKTKKRARDTIFWPGINNEIENLAKYCNSCQTYANSNKREKLIKHEIPNYAWQKVATDLFEYKNRHYLIIVDYYSKFFETVLLPNTTSGTIITYMKHIFSRHGIPDIVISDNGPQYSSREFSCFSNEWCFKHITSSPRYPQSNGLVERCIQTIKNTLKKCELSKTDPYLAMLELRNTPVYGMYSPTELIYGRKIRGLMPTSINRKINHRRYRETLGKFQNRYEEQYNKHARNLEPLHIGENIRVNINNKWEKGEIIEKNNLKPRSYNIKLNSGSIIERNRKFLKKDYRRGYQGEHSHNQGRITERNRKFLKQDYPKLCHKGNVYIPFKYKKKNDNREVQGEHRMQEGERTEIVLERRENEVDEQQNEKAQERRENVVDRPENENVNEEVPQGERSGDEEENSEDEIVRPQTYTRFGRKVEPAKRYWLPSKK